jgi:hypothetical protein
MLLRIDFESELVTSMPILALGLSVHALDARRGGHAHDCEKAWESVMMTVAAGAAGRFDQIDADGAMASSNGTGSH